MRELEERKDIEQHIKDLVQKITMTVLIIDGKTLDSILMSGEQIEQEFFLLAIKAPCVCVCRCSPTQKARIC